MCGGWWKRYAAPRAGDGIDSGHIELSVARLFIQCTKLHMHVHVTEITVRQNILAIQNWEFSLLG